jgi:hypothetical protein
MCSTVNRIFHFSYFDPAYPTWHLREQCEWSHCLVEFHQFTDKLTSQSWQWYYFLEITNQPRPKWMMWSGIKHQEKLIPTTLLHKQKLMNMKLSEFPNMLLHIMKFNFSPKHDSTVWTPGETGCFTWPTNYLCNPRKLKQRGKRFLHQVTLLVLTNTSIYANKQNETPSANMTPK